MTRVPREDQPGSWHHVFNRALARRTLFERREDYRFFLAHMARAVRRGEVEVHAYSLMGTHYHLLLRSPVGKLSAAMQRIQLAYSRWFNRSRRRDGHLVRGRYGSRPVGSLRYRRQLVRYIDFNPCMARLVDRPSKYPWGSAHHYSKANGPVWLERSWVESMVADQGDSDRYLPELYEEAFPTRNAAELAELVKARLGHGDGLDYLDDIFSAADAPTRAWMTRKAILADGTHPGLPLMPLARLQRIVEGRRERPWTVQRGRSERDGWSVAYVGLGRDLTGATLDRLASDLRISPTKARRLYAFHREELEERGAYSAALVALAYKGLEDMEMPDVGVTEPGSSPHTAAQARGDAAPSRGGVRR